MALIEMDFANGGGGIEPASNLNVLTKADGTTGTASASSQVNSAYGADHAFNRNVSNSDYWAASSAANAYLRYQFNNAVTCKVVTVYSQSANTYKVQGSSNGTSWDDLGEITISATLGWGSAILPQGSEYTYFQLLNLTSATKPNIVQVFFFG